MENMSPALFLVGATLVATLIVGIGMQIYNTAASTIMDSYSYMSTSQIEAFNMNFESYKGTQTGSQVSSLVGRLIANASTFRDEPEKVPSVHCELPEVEAIYDKNSDENLEEYTNKIAEIKNRIENKHKYIVEFEYDAITGLLSDITIRY